MRTEEYVFYKKKHRNRKFMQALETAQIRTLTKWAKKRGIGLQEYLRAIVIPDWLYYNAMAEKKKTRK